MPSEDSGPGHWARDWRSRKDGLEVQIAEVRRRMLTVEGRWPALATHHFAGEGNADRNVTG
jgi:hypothetical protein